MAKGNHNGVTAKLRGMRIGEMIVLSADKALNACLLANRIGIKIMTRKQGKGSRRKVWRLA